MVISVGYAACHWCHVMENESFSDSEVAELQNRFYVSVKVDREERPDVDQVYMLAAHLLSGSGGWPLNVVALPDGRPVYAGTYFPKQQWLSLLSQLGTMWQNEPEKLMKQAEVVAEAMNRPHQGIKDSIGTGIQLSELERVFANWTKIMDEAWGGTQGAPKFPMPTGLRFLLNYFHFTKEKEALSFVKTTLNRMAQGGIYDQIGGGFARYSTDAHWKVPHFEKMLYDNAQLVSLYTQAWQVTGEPLYKRTVYQTLDFVERELMSSEGGFFSSLDADSEGEEGTFYVWTENEIEGVLGKENLAPRVKSYYGISAGGNWEDGKNVLFRSVSDNEAAGRMKIPKGELLEQIANANKLLFDHRSKRIRPGLDDKILASWHAMMVVGYADAYKAFGDERFLRQAELSSEFFITYFISSEGQLTRDKRGKINGFLDDYAYAIQMGISMYQITLQSKWLYQCRSWMEYVLTHFSQKEEPMFFYTSDEDAPLISRQREEEDNVIPSSNSVMAENLVLLGTYFYRDEWIEKARQMVEVMQPRFEASGPYYSNWARISLYFSSAPFEVVVAGEGAQSQIKTLFKHFLPQMILAGGDDEKLPILKHKSQGEEGFFICRNKTCDLPTDSTADVLKKISI